MSFSTRLATSIVATDAPLAQQVAAAADRGADLVELRADLIGDVRAIEGLLQAPRPLPLIITVRAAAEGGAWTAGEQERVALLARLARLAPDFIDVELATWRTAAPLRETLATTQRRDRDRRPRLILSQHDPRRTPTDLAAALSELAQAPADVRKAAFLAADATDALRLLEALRSVPNPGSWALLSMGAGGVAGRLLARKFGAFLSFAALERGRESAPGQLTLDEMRGLYGWDRLRASTRVYGVVGWPVSHSRSPAVHNAAMAHAGIDGAYVPFAVAPAPAALDAFLDHANVNPELDLAGLSVTIPHKQAALVWLDRSGGRVSRVARRCGAVNTLVRDEHGWRGENTDIDGVMHALSAGGVSAASLRGLRAAVLGAGGVARAVAATLIDNGAAVTLFNRTSARASELARELGCGAGDWQTRAHAQPDLIANCTSVGMTRMAEARATAAPDTAHEAGGENEPPSSELSPWPADALRPETIVFDSVYTPARTRLLADAAERGCRVVSGADMFLGQAMRQFELWHSQAAPEEAMRAAI